jgi:hypothetical protein
MVIMVILMAMVYHGLIVIGPDTERVSELEMKYDALLHEYVYLETKHGEIQAAHAKLDKMFVFPDETALTFTGVRLETNGATIDEGHDETAVVCSPKYYQTPIMQNGHLTGMFMGTLYECKTNLFTWEMVPVYSTTDPMERKMQIRCVVLDDGRILPSTCSFHVWPGKEPVLVDQAEPADSSQHREIDNGLLTLGMLSLKLLLGIVFVSVLTTLILLKLLLVFSFVFVGCELIILFYTHARFHARFMMEYIRETSRKCVNRVIKWAQQ